MAHVSFHHSHLSLCYHHMPSNKITLCLCIGTQKIIQNACPLYLLYFNVHDIWIYVLTPSCRWHPIAQIYEPIFLPVLVNRRLPYFVFFDVLTLTVVKKLVMTANSCSVIFLINSIRESKWPRGLRRRSTAARLLRSWVRIPRWAWMFVCCVCCVLSGRGLCDGLIIRSGESYRLWRVAVCEQVTSYARRLKPDRGL